MTRLEIIEALESMQIKLEALENDMATAYKLLDAKRPSDKKQGFFEKIFGKK